jgi:hypothetical protein
MTETYKDATDYDSRRKHKELSSTEKEYETAKEQERQYTISRRLAALKKTQRERSRPIQTRVQRVGERGFQEVEKSYEMTGKTLSKKGGSRLRAMASKMLGVSSDRPVIRTGLSSIADEIVEGHVPIFERSFLKEPNQADRDFFGDQNQPQEKDFFGNSGLGPDKMNTLVSLNQNKKTVEGGDRYV